MCAPDVAVHLEHAPEIVQLGKESPRVAPLARQARLTPEAGDRLRLRHAEHDEQRGGSDGDDLESGHCTLPSAGRRRTGSTAVAVPLVGLHRSGGYSQVWLAIRRRYPTGENGRTSGRDERASARPSGRHGACWTVASPRGWHRSCCYKPCEPRRHAGPLLRFDSVGRRSSEFAAGRANTICIALDRHGTRGGRPRRIIDDPRRHLPTIEAWVTELSARWDEVVRRGRGKAVPG